MKTRIESCFFDGFRKALQSVSLSLCHVLSVCTSVRQRLRMFLLHSCTPLYLAHVYRTFRQVSLSVVANLLSICALAVMSGLVSFVVVIVVAITTSSVTATENFVRKCLCFVGGFHFSIKQIFVVWVQPDRNLIVNIST